MAKIKVVKKERIVGVDMSEFQYPVMGYAVHESFVSVKFENEGEQNIIALNGVDLIKKVLPTLGLKVVTKVY